MNFSSFFTNLNNIHPTIKFKVEWEKDNSLPFLDTLMTRKNGQLMFQVYRKPTNSNSYIHYFSVHDDSVKLAVISSMFLRAYRICDPAELSSEIDKIFSIFKDLAYPQWFIKKAQLKARKSFYNVNRNSVNNFSNCIALPFNPNLVPMKDVCNDSNINVTFNYPNTIGRKLIRNKPRQDVDGIGVYAVKCRHCPKVYIGETGKALKDRFYYHKRDIRVGNQNNSIFNHMLQEDHPVDINNPILVYKSQDPIERKVIESTLIQRIPNFNTSEGQYKINDVVGGILFKQLNHKGHIRQFMDNPNTPDPPGD